MRRINGHLYRSITPVFLNFISCLFAPCTTVVQQIKEGGKRNGGDTERQREERLIVALAQFEFDGFVFVSKQEDRVSSSAGNTFQPK